MRDLRCRVGFDVHFAISPQIFKIAGQPAESIRFRVRKTGQVDPIIVDIRLQEAGADCALRAEFANVRNWDVSLYRRATGLAYGGNIEPRSNNPIALRPAR